MNMSPVVHFEMGYHDQARMVTFYETAFGWKAQRLGPEMGNYVVAQTADTDAHGMVTQPGAINGGFYAKTDSPDSQAPSVVIAVADLPTALQAVTAAGGTILGAMDAQGQTTLEPMLIPGVGLWIAIQDTEGNRVSLLQPTRPSRP